LRKYAKLFIEVPIFGCFGKRFYLLNLRDSLKSSSDYLSRFRSLRIPAKLSIEVPIFG
jgi:hypothetical protein